MGLYLEENDCLTKRCLEAPDTDVGRMCLDTMSDDFYAAIVIMHLGGKMTVPGSGSRDSEAVLEKS